MINVRQHLPFLQEHAVAQGVSKATGLGAALDMLRASPRNTVAVGDAENDHELLRIAEEAIQL